MTWHISLSLGEFRKNPHVKIPPKSPCVNFQSLGIFKNQILFGNEFSPSLLAHPAFRPRHGPFFFFNRPFFFLPSPTRLRTPGRPNPPSRPNRPPSSSSRTGAERARRRRPASRRPQGRPRHLHRKKRKRLHQSPSFPH
jgi:hypothetical protein